MQIDFPCKCGHNEEKHMIVMENITPKFGLCYSCVTEETTRHYYEADNLRYLEQCYENNNCR